MKASNAFVFYCCAPPLTLAGVEEKSIPLNLLLLGEGRINCVIDEEGEGYRSEVDFPRKSFGSCLPLLSCILPFTHRHFQLLPPLNVSNLSESESAVSKYLSSKQAPIVKFDQSSACVPASNPQLHNETYLQIFIHTRTSSNEQNH